MAKSPRRKDADSDIAYKIMGSAWAYALLSKELARDNFKFSAPYDDRHLEYIPTPEDGSFYAYRIIDSSIVLGFLGIELVFKALAVLKGSYLEIHSLTLLFADLDDNIKDKLRKDYHRNGYGWGLDNLDKYLEHAENGFVEHRYAFEREKQKSSMSLPQLPFDLWVTAAERFPYIKVDIGIRDPNL